MGGTVTVPLVIFGGEVKAIEDLTSGDSGMLLLLSLKSVKFTENNHIY